MELIVRPNKPYSDQTRFAKGDIFIVYQYNTGVQDVCCVSLKKSKYKEIANKTAINCGIRPILSVKIKKLKTGKQRLDYLEKQAERSLQRIHSVIKIQEVNSTK